GQRQVRGVAGLCRSTAAPGFAWHWPCTSIGRTHCETASHREPFLCTLAPPSRTTSGRLRLAKHRKWSGKEALMRMQVHELALSIIEALAPMMPLIQRQDRSLALQLRASASSIVLNIAEAAYSDPGNKRARFFSAAGSANESRSAIRVAVAWRYVS